MNYDIDIKLVDLSNNQLKERVHSKKVMDKEFKYLRKTLKKSTKQEREFLEELSELQKDIGEIERSKAKLVNLKDQYTGLRSQRALRERDVKSMQFSYRKHTKVIGDASTDIRAPPKAVQLPSIRLWDEANIPPSHLPRDQRLNSKIFRITECRGNK
jgi:DNA repair exonuclease SbcCD ATPase subunit